MIFLAARLILLLTVCSLGPGLWIVGRLKWSPTEKLCGAFAASFIAVYLASFFLFCTNSGAASYWAAVGVFAVLGLLGWRTAVEFVRNRRVRMVLVCFAVVLCWDFLHLAMIHGYSGGGWGGDWHEHYDRTRFFLHQLPLNFDYLGRYSLAARPPMMNAMAAFYCRLVGLSFEAYSLVMLTLNAWAFVPCCWLMRRFAPRGRRLEPVLAALFMLNPSILQNATYTWTKAFAAAWVVVGICFYLRRRIVAAAITLTAGVLVHYSAAPFAVAVGLHCLATRYAPAMKIIASGLAAAALLSTWLIWSMAHLGIATTFHSPAVTTGAPDPTVAENLGRFSYNLMTSLVPHVFHSAGPNPESTVLRNVHTLRNLRDYYFTMAQTCLPTMIGVISGLAALIWMMQMFLSGDRRRRGEKQFWIFFLIFASVVGVAVNYTRTAVGSAHLTMVPIALMGVTLVAAWLPSARPGAFRIVLAGLAVDYCLGILLQFTLESMVPQLVIQGGRAFLVQDPELGGNTLGEYYAKLQGGYVFWGDHLVDWGPALQVVSVVTAVGVLWFLVRIHSRRLHEIRRIADLTL